MRRLAPFRPRSLASPTIRGSGTISRGRILNWAATRLGRYQEALADNERARSLMDFGMARKQREIILKKIG